MKKAWKEIDILRHAIGNEKLELKFLVEYAKKLSDRVEKMETKLFKLIENVEKTESTNGVS